MELGTSFLKSRIARRFCLLFVLCAFIPTVALIAVSYNRVVSQLEEQSHIRLKRDVKSYSLALYDRLIRVNNDLRSVGRNLIANELAPSSSPLYDSKEISGQLSGIVSYAEASNVVPVFGEIDFTAIEPFITSELLANDKPYILVRKGSLGHSKVYVGVNFKHNAKKAYTIIGEVLQTYLYGVGPEPLLPPMTELIIYDSTGDLIQSTLDSVPSDFKDLNNQSNSKDLRVFEFNAEGIAYFASISNLFLESNFQKTGWVIILSQARSDAMSAMDSFKQSFPFIILFFLLLILYLSVFFIRKGLSPLEKLKEGTRRVGNKDFATVVDIKSNDEFEDLGNSFNNMALKLDQQFTTLSVLSDIDRAILSSLDSTELVATTLNSMRQFFKCDVSMYVKNSKASSDHVKVVLMEGKRRNDSQVDYYSLEAGEQEKIFIDFRHMFFDKENDWPSLCQRVSSREMSMFLCLPLQVGGTINRVLLLGWKNSTQLTEDEITQSRQIADQVAIALSNAKLLSDMENLAKGTIEALARTVDAKSKWTAGHSERVAVLSGRIAKAMGVTVAEEETVIRGGLLHDIGKIGIPVSILNKHERLTEEEFAEIKSHPQIGATILKPIEAYQDILPLVRQHHEKFDGTGYPDGLKGDEIDLRARIMAVADVWDAVVSDRPYRAGWIHDKAQKMIIEGAGTHFDPLVVESFLTVLSEG